MKGHSEVEFLIDHRRAFIEKGCVVAYNLSGEIAIGRVLDAKPRIISVKNGHYKTVQKCSIKIEIMFPVKLKGMSGHISTVRSPKNVMVIRET